ncbi:hypothetical protein DITRI_Ditri03aG0078100 [Diplodiscus trichospermus]
MPFATNLLSFSIYVLIHSILFLLLNVWPSSETNYAEPLCLPNYGVPLPLCFQTNFAEPHYSQSRSYPYEYKIKTQKGVNYYVKSTNFEHDYPVNSPELVRIEDLVEKEYYSILARNCRFELQRQQWGFIREHHIVIYCRS